MPSIARVTSVISSGFRLRLERASRIGTVKLLFSNNRSLYCKGFLYDPYFYMHSIERRCPWVILLVQAAVHNKTLDNEKNSN